MKMFFSQDSGKLSPDFIECNKHRQFIFTGSSMQEEQVDRLKQIFPDIVDVKSHSYGRVPPGVA